MTLKCPFQPIASNRVVAHYAERALRAGAFGYLNKDQTSDKIIEAIRRVLDGKV